MMLCVQCNLCWFHYLFYSCMKRRTADNNKPFLVYFCTISMLHNICYLLPGIFFIMPKDVEIALFTINPEHFWVKLHLQTIENILKFHMHKSLWSYQFEIYLITYNNYIISIFSYGSYDLYELRRIKVLYDWKHE